MQAFDYIVIGAGSAGCAVAARLSEDPGTRVLLLEAGPEDSNPWIHVPVGYYRTMFDPRIGWGYTTAPIPGSAGRSITWPRGKVLGGSSATVRCASCCARTRVPRERRETGKQSGSRCTLLPRMVQGWFTASLPVCASYANGPVSSSRQRSAHGATNDEDPIMNTNRTKRGTAGRFAAVVAVGLLTLGASGIASADDDRGYRSDHRVQVIHHDQRGYHPGRGHHNGHRRGKQVVHVYHHQPRVVQRQVVVVERPVVYERHVVVEHHVAVERPQQYYGSPGYYNSYGGGGAQLNAGSLIGAAIGGLLGSQVGNGSGQLAATAAGTIGGFVLGGHHGFR